MKMTTITIAALALLSSVAWSQSTGQETDEAARREAHRRAVERERARREAPPPWVAEALRRKAKRDRERAARGETGESPRVQKQSRDELLRSMPREQARAFLRAEEEKRKRRHAAQRLLAEEHRLEMLEKRAAARGMTVEEFQELQSEGRRLGRRGAAARNERWSSEDIERVKHLRRLARLDRLATLAGDVDGDLAELSERIETLRRRERERHQQVSEELEARRPHGKPTAPDTKGEKARQ